MVTTQDFSNFPTINNEEGDIKRNALTKEDLEGKVKNNTTSQSSNVNGGSVNFIELNN